MTSRTADRSTRWFTVRILTAAALAAAVLPTIGLPARAAPSGKPVVTAPAPRFSDAVAHDESAPLTALARSAARTAAAKAPQVPQVPQVPKERGVTASDNGFTGDTARQSAPISGAPVTFPIANFEGLSNQDNFDVFGGRVNPPDPVGDVGPNHYVEMVNMVFGVLQQDGHRCCSARSTSATLWAGFAVDDCTDPSGRPDRVYDQFADRWILTQFTTRGLDDPTSAVLQLRRHLHHRRPDGLLLPLRVHVGLQLPGLPEVRRVDDSYVVTTPRVRTDESITASASTASRRADARRRPGARAVSFFIDGNAGAASTCR